MRPHALARALLATLSLSAATALAQQAPPLARTLILPGPAATPALHLRPQLATTLEFGFPLRAWRLSGPGADALTVQQLEPHVLSLYPARALGPFQTPTLTATAEDGSTHAFSLVMDERVDVQVRVQLGACLLTEDLHEATAQLLLREPVAQAEQVAFINRLSMVESNATRLSVRGMLPLSRLSLLTLRLDDTHAPFVPGELQVEGASGRLRVLGMSPLDKKQLFSTVLERPEGEPDGLPYTLTLLEKDGPRRLVIRGVEPWPLRPALPAKVEAPQGPAEADADGGARHRKLPRSKVLQHQ
jgi:hypothetical protein